MNADGRIEVIRCDAIEFNAYGQINAQIIVWEHNPDCDIPADWVTCPSGEWNFGMWLDENGIIVIPAEVRATQTWYDPERAAHKWWADHGWLIQQGGFWR